MDVALIVSGSFFGYALLGCVTARLAMFVRGWQHGDEIMVGCFWPLAGPVLLSWWLTGLPGRILERRRRARQEHRRILATPLDQLVEEVRR